MRVLRSRIQIAVQLELHIQQDSDSSPAEAVHTARIGHSFELIGVLCEASDTSSCGVDDCCFYRHQRQASSLYKTGAKSAEAAPTNC